MGPADGIVDVTVTVDVNLALATPVNSAVDRLPVGSVHPTNHAASAMLTSLKTGRADGMDGFSG
jgi:hypothetical protein